jgi:hypothetical protein
MSRRVAVCSRLFPGISAHFQNLAAAPRDTFATWSTAIRRRGLAAGKKR